MLLTVICYFTDLVNSSQVQIGWNCCEHLGRGDFTWNTSSLPLPPGEARSFVMQFPNLTSSFYSKGSKVWWDNSSIHGGRLTAPQRAQQQLVNQRSQCSFSPLCSLNWYKGHSLVYIACLFWNFFCKRNIWPGQNKEVIGPHLIIFPEKLEEYFYQAVFFHILDLFCYLSIVLVTR